MIRFIFFTTLFGMVVSCKSKIDIKNEMETQRIAYFQAFGVCRIDLIEDLKFKYGFSNDEISSTGTTPLMISAYRNRPQCVEYLLKNNAQVQLMDSAKRSALYYAIEGKNPNSVKQILETGKANAEVRDDFNLTPLMVASKLGQIEIMKLLLHNKANVNSLDENGWTPLFFAVVSKNLEAVKLLVESGADIKITDKDGRLSKDIAYEDLSFQISDFLEKKLLQKNQAGKKAK